MAKFCVNCGAGLAEGARFCPNCGAAVSAPAPPMPATPNLPVSSGMPAGFEAPPAPPIAPPPAPPVAYPPVASYAPPAQGSGTGIKILFIVLGVIAFLCLLLAGSCFYVAYKVKQKATALKVEMGGTAPKYTGARDACSKLTETEVSDALKQKITAVESRGSMACIYHFGPNGEKQVPVNYTWEGGAIALKLSHGALKQISGMETMTPLSGLGDEAYLAPEGSALLMRKGDVMVEIDMRAAGLNADAAKAMAAKIAGRL